MEMVIRKLWSAGENKGELSLLLNQDSPSLSNIKVSSIHSNLLKTFKKHLMETTDLPQKLTFWGNNDDIVDLKNRASGNRVEMKWGGFTKI
jgi:hypothetical protein